MDLELRHNLTGSFFSMQGKGSNYEDLGFSVRASKRHSLACEKDKLTQATSHVAPAATLLEENHVICKC